MKVYKQRAMYNIHHFHDIVYYQWSRWMKRWKRSDCGTARWREDSGREPLGWCGGEVLSLTGPTEGVLEDHWWRTETQPRPAAPANPNLVLRRPERLPTCYHVKLAHSSTHSTGERRPLATHQAWASWTCSLVLEWNARVTTHTTTLRKIQICCIKFGLCPLPA